MASRFGKAGARFLYKSRIFFAPFAARELHPEYDMIPLMTPSLRGRECAAAIEAALNQPTKLAHSLHDAVTCLREEEFSAVLLDQSLLETDSDQADVVEQHLGTATPVYVNCAISGTPRVIRELRAALHRRNKEATVARKAAEQVSHSELRECLTAMLLDCEPALALPNLPPQARDKIRAVDRMAHQIAEKVEIEEPAVAHS